MIIRPASAADFPAVLALNQASVQFLSPLDAARLGRLHAEACLHLLVELEDRIGAFLLAFREGANYDSPNYRWFQTRYPHFLYVDRVVVDATARGQGLGKRLYQRVFDTARALGTACVACEFDLDPPNPISAAFHAHFGFREVGRQAVMDGKKQVSLQVACLSGRGQARSP
ncbi:GNAT family N-acetyltransferase [Pseudomarimonas arenosa]|uniref:GNAT family N-acetyltransferase n=1 Tax=Pseudomarimonas arenosa TaxID=2774145 RepID=A0AAW3ZP53_9GAMM|nr:GNAT family N-acetyltransferase [Pseudomarimonas arenosa]MBD8526424.1 GNAT family N-acetyltransferase [Pseudomarimonas arenosa]